MWLSHETEILVDALRDRPLTLILAHVGPGALNVWHRALVDGIRVCCAKLEQHSTAQMLAIQHLWLGPFEDSLAQCRDLLQELRTVLAIVHGLQVLECTLILDWAHESAAVAILEEQLYHASDPVLLLDGVAVALLRLQGVLQVLLLVDCVAISVDEAQTEVAHYPQERWEVLLDFSRVCLAKLLRLLDLQLLRQVNDEAERVDRILINCVHRVEDEV